MSWAPDYLDPADLRDEVRLVDTVDDARLQLIVTAASRAIDRRCNRQFGQLAAPAVRTYRRRPAYDYTTGLWLLEVDDLMDTTAMTINGVALAASGCVLLPDDAPANGRPYERIGFADDPNVGEPYPGSPITANVAYARWGWTAYPAGVVLACKLQGNRWVARRDTPLGIAGSPEQGNEKRLLARLDPDVATTLAGLSRRRRAG